MRLDYTKRSLRHLQAIHDYIAHDDPEAADRAVRRIREAAGRLETLPWSGRSSIDGTRLLVVPGLPYVVVHRLNADVIQILSIFHTAQKRRR